jgi:hypothetical protein
MRDECGKIGRDPAEIEVTTGDNRLDLDVVRRYEEIGVSRLIMPPPAFDSEGLRRSLTEFADRVIAKASLATSDSARNDKIPGGLRP